uniref:Uncharacterized protein n=1 Tax=Oryza brachyantha TaxID=4533 RepID=J3LWM2_ORYBR
LLRAPRHGCRPTRLPPRDQPSYNLTPQPSASPILAAKNNKQTNKKHKIQLESQTMIRATNPPTKSRTPRIQKSQRELSSGFLRLSTRSIIKKKVPTFCSRFRLQKAKEQQPDRSTEQRGRHSN